MAESTSSSKRSFGPAWRKDGGTFGAPVKAPSPVENGNGDAILAPPGSPRAPFGAPASILAAEELLAGSVLRELAERRGTL